MLYFEIIAVNTGIMADKDKILKSLYSAVEEVNDILPEEQELSNSPETALYGQESKLDSVNLVQFIVTAEQKIEDDFGVSITLASEKAFSMKNSPFRSIGTLADFAEAALDSATSDA